MRGFLAVILGLILLSGAVLSVKLSTHLMNKSIEQLEHFWRWRFLGVLTLLAGVALVALAFILIPRFLK